MYQKEDYSFHTKRAAAARSEVAAKCFELHAPTRSRTSKFLQISYNVPAIRCFEYVTKKLLTYALCSVLAEFVIMYVMHSLRVRRSVDILIDVHINIDDPDSLAMQISIFFQWKITILGQLPSNIYSMPSNLINTSTFNYHALRK